MVRQMSGPGQASSWEKERKSFVVKERELGRGFLHHLATRWAKMAQKSHPDPLNDLGSWGGCPGFSKVIQLGLGALASDRARVQKKDLVDLPVHHPFESIHQSQPLPRIQLATEDTVLDPVSMIKQYLRGLVPPLVIEDVIADENEPPGHDATS